MNQEEMRNEFYALYNMMANSQKVENMRTFGNAQKEMMEWFIVNKPDLAREWIDKLESIRWKNYLSTKEADYIVANMNPKAPWTRDQWKAAMEQHGFDMEREPCYDCNALFVVMEMIMSDSASTLSKYVDGNDMFKVVYELAVDKLTDKDSVFSVRKYFSV